MTADPHVKVPGMSFTYMEALVVTGKQSQCRQVTIHCSCSVYTTMVLQTSLATPNKSGTAATLYSMIHTGAWNSLNMT